MSFVGNARLDSKSFRKVAWQEELQIAGEFTNRDLDFKFTEYEKYWLAKFFSNSDRHIFAFHQSVPDVVKSYSLARYSRIQNPRGLRGILLEDVIPQWIVSRLPEFRDASVDKIRNRLAELKIKSVEDLQNDGPLGSIAYLSATQLLNFLGRPEEIAKLSKDEKLKKLFNTYVDGYGHNSIVRTGCVSLCFENISIIVDKILQQNRFTAPIEKSTRFVDFTKKAYFPIHKIIGIYQPDYEPIIFKHIDNLFELYGWQMDRDRGFQKFLERRWADKMPQGFKLEPAIFGEACDVLGNFLPGATLTSMGLTVSGEALPNIIRRLYAEPIAEAHVVADAVIREVGVIGAESYLRHTDEISEWQQVDWQELAFDASSLFLAESNKSTQNNLLKLFKGLRQFEDCEKFQDVCDILGRIVRSSYDKLFDQFEIVTVTMRDKVSFRTSRDLDRHTQSTVSRSAVTPLNGFYRYPKPISSHLSSAFDVVAEADLRIWSSLRGYGIDVKDLEYMLAMGNNVIFEMSNNLKQHELVVKTRSKYDVNDEARSWMLKFEEKVRKRYPWYAQLSRADMTPHYVFARGADEKNGMKMPELMSAGGPCESD